jgi:FAD binding domain
VDVGSVNASAPRKVEVVSAPREVRQLKGRPEATLGPLDMGPFYVVQVHPGALDTKGGPRTDGNGQVIDLDGAPIPGLYAAGNVMASAMGMTYGGAGGTLGPCMGVRIPQRTTRRSGKPTAGRCARCHHQRLITIADPAGIVPNLRSPCSRRRQRARRR